MRCIKILVNGDVIAVVATMTDADIIIKALQMNGYSAVDFSREYTISTDNTLFTKG